ncbi:hypothetical protein VPNG_09007 [Cytospora leucostoma]|uniref:DUF7820 domain-containing protein n=1 Tax=Cytospora leucostoma TaxID=1230097 RepID=A0A423VZY6_9PEZI|nr:hypothetical protein VPNG_09007 [Cytospora leucostoma]
MDNTDGKATEPERRASVRSSRRLSTAQPDGGYDDDDDYALLALGVSDGFRPQPMDTNDHNNAQQPVVRPDSEVIPQTQPSSQPIPQPTIEPIEGSTSSPSRLNRSSISKPPKGRDSLTLRHDGPMGHVAGLSQSRVSSTSTQSPYINNEAPYEGPSAPSHPYQMYSQNTRLARTLSVATTSSTPTTRPESEYNGPRGPAHPYSMYPQNPFTDTSSAVGAPTVPIIPVGFVNNTDPYQRRLGPEGEESRNSTRTSTNESHHEVNTAAAPLSEKPQLNRLQRFAKRKACGVIPYWAICLTVTAILVVMIIVGAVVGTLLSRHHKDPHDQKPAPSTYQDSIPTVTITYDAVPVATPTDLPALPTGIYSLPLNLDKSPNTCFNNTAQTSAWSCQIIFEEATQMQMSIGKKTPQLDDEGDYDILLIVNSTLNGNYNPLSYGTQPPQIEPAIGLQLVNDTFDLDRGPAWFRMLPYNKTVLVPEDLLSVSSSSSSSKARRNGGGFPPRIGDLQRKGGVAQTGDKPWLCTWPGTVVEVFIYAEQNSSYAYQTLASTGVITSAPTATPTATSTSSGYDAIHTTTTDVSSYMPLASYPRAIKVKERRTPQSSSPYCVQVTVNDDNTSTTPVLNSEGKPVTIYIVENEPGSAGASSSEDTTIQSTSKARRHSRGIEDSEQRLYRRDDDGDMSACGCMWFSS